MKRVFMILIATVFLFTGCQSAPATPEATNAVSIEALASTASEQSTADVLTVSKSPLYETLGAPESYTAQITAYEGKLIIDGTAAVVLPPVDAIPSVEVKKHLFTQAEADRFLSVLCGTEAFYESNYTISRAEAAEKLQNFYDMRDGKIPVNVDGENPQDFDKLAALIEEYEKLLQSLPEETGPREMRRSFHTPESGLNPDAQIIEGIATAADGDSLYFCVNNGFFDENDVCLVYQRVKAGHHYGKTKPGDFTPWSELSTAHRAAYGNCLLAQEDAERIGDALLESLGITGLTLYRMEPAARLADNSGNGSLPDHLLTGNIVERGWSMIYSRVVGGVPVTQTSVECSGVVDEEASALPWKYERVSITIHEDGTIVYLQYLSPYEPGETIAQETKLLPFSEIQSVFESLAAVPYRHIKDAGDASNRHYTLTEVRLGLMRITEINKRDAGRLIPVWDFMAEYTSGSEQPKSGVVLTINAMDGSIIERKMGY